MNEQTKPKQRRHPHTHYKLSEKDHPLILDALQRFVPVYQIALKIGCGYHTLLEYVHNHPELEQAGKDAEANMVALGKGQLMKKVMKGHAGSIMFLLERLDREHFGRFATIENVGELPAINIGVFAEDDCPAPVNPADVGEDAASIIRGAAAMARARQEAEDAAELAEIEAHEAGEDDDEPPEDYAEEQAETTDSIF